MDSFVRSLLLTLVAFMGLCACTHDPLPAVNIPEIQSVECTDLTDCTVILKAKIVNLPAASECGFRYGTSMDLEEANSQTVSALILDGASASADITGLNSFTTYYYQVYVRCADKVLSSEVKSFTTMRSLSEIPDDPEAMDLEAVDLGLSIKWSNLNLGAIRPEFSGFLYSWGETQTKSLFTWDTYVFSDSLTRVSKYNIDKTKGNIDYKIFLEPADDAASVGINVKWRVPTKDEWQELIDKCDWEWTDDYDGTLTPGYIIHGRGEYSDRSIFLPESGNSLGLPFGLYWTSTLDKTNTLNAHCFGMDELMSVIRSAGMMIRPVYGDTAFPAVESLSFPLPELNYATFDLGRYDMLWCYAVLDIVPSVVRDREIIVTSSSPGVATAEVVDDAQGLDYVLVRVYPHNYGTTELTAVTIDGGLKVTIKVVINRPDVDMLDGTKIFFKVADGDIDLGLSVLWSSFNLGAYSFSPIGDSYMWGHTTPVGAPDSTNVNCYNHYGNYVGFGNSWKSYKHCEGTNTTLTKYNNAPYYGKVDGLRVLLPEDDAATAALGEGWRTATFAEWEELRTECSWTYIKNYNNLGINAWKVTSRVPGFEECYIILADVRYWTSDLGSVSTSAVNYAWNLEPDGIFFHGREAMSRTEGFAVRPVKDK